MSSSNSNKHLTLQERSIIETGIRNRSSKKAIADTLNDILKINMGIGVLILAVGIFLVVRNYRYYLKKARSANTEKEIVEKIRNEEASGY